MLTRSEHRLLRAIEDSIGKVVVTPWTYISDGPLRFREHLAVVRGGFKRKREVQESRWVMQDDKPVRVWPEEDEHANDD